jgi:hypothetical protein
MDGLMTFRTLLSSLGCIIAWCLLLPVLVIGGGAILLIYAVLSEFGALLTGSGAGSLDPTTAREISRRICQGYDVSPLN